MDETRIVDYYSLLYVRPVVCMIGFFLNLVCILVFAEKSVHHEAKGHMFKYFLLKSVFDTLSLGLISLSPLFYYYFFDNRVETTLVSVVYQKYFMIYLSTVCSMAATIFEVLATVDRLFIVKQNCLTKYYEKLSFRFVSLASVVLSFVALAFSLLNVRIDKLDFDYQNQPHRLYYLMYDGIADGDLRNGLYMMSTILRDVVSVVLLIIVNILLSVQLRSQMQIKKKLAQANKHLEVKAESCEIKNTIMVLVLSVASILQHLPYIFFYMDFLKSSPIVSACLSDYQGIMFCFFQSISIFGYLFNRKFNQGLRELFCGFKKAPHMPHLHLPHLHFRGQTRLVEEDSVSYQHRPSISTIDPRSVSNSCSVSVADLSVTSSK